MVLWDFTNGTMGKFNTYKLKSRVIKAKRYLRKRDRSAFVISKDVDFGIGRMIQTYSNIEGIKTTMSIFHDKNKATEWLMELYTDHK